MEDIILRLYLCLNNRERRLLKGGQQRIPCLEELAVSKRVCSLERKLGSPAITENWEPRRRERP